mmetsp:Transcript_54611/g.158034  ORF Transcript_54611/g.158034 Transcript_54611/m.158034 type:complete len:231 (-) Transcript_54611:1007-1699(-)
MTRRNCPKVMPRNSGLEIVQPVPSRNSLRSMRVWARSFAVLSTSVRAVGNPPELLQSSSERAFMKKPSAVCTNACPSSPTTGGSKMTSSVCQASLAGSTKGAFGNVVSKGNPSCGAGGVGVAPPGDGSGRSSSGPNGLATSLGDAGGWSSLAGVSSTSSTAGGGSTTSGCGTGFASDGSRSASRRASATGCTTGCESVGCTAAVGESGGCGTTDSGEAGSCHATLGCAAS